MNAWGDEDPPLVESEPPSPRRLRGRHIVAIGIVVAALGPVVSLTGALALGPMLIVLGLVLATFGACGWLFERLGAWDDDPGGSESIRLTDVAKLATRNRRH